MKSIEIDLIQGNQENLTVQILTTPSMKTKENANRNIFSPTKIIVKH